MLYQKFCILIDEQDNSSELLKNIPSDDYEEKIYQLLLHGKNFFGLDRNVFHNDKKNYLINYVNIIKKNFTDIKKNIVHMITNNILINDPEFEALPIELIQKHLFKNNFALFAHTFITDQLEPAAKGKIPFALFLKNQIIYCNQNLSQVLGQPGKDFIKDNKNLLIHDFISYCKVLAVEDNILIKIKDNAEYKKVVDFLSYYAFGIYCEEVKKGFRKKIDELKEIPPSFEAMAVIHKNLLEKNLRCEGYRIFEACYGYKRSKNL